jgi:hypothetical protein
LEAGGPDYAKGRRASRQFHGANLPGHPEPVRHRVAVSKDLREAIRVYPMAEGLFVILARGCRVKNPGLL